MKLSFGSIQGYIQAFIADDSTATLAVIKEEINREYRRLAVSREWPGLTCYLTAGTTTVSGQTYMALPGDCAQLVAMTDPTNLTIFRELGKRQLIEDNVATISDSRRVVEFTHMGEHPIRRPLSVADTLQFTPASALSAEADIRVRGLLDDQDHEGESAITTSGTTPQDTSQTYRAGWTIHSIGTNTKVSQDIEIAETTSGTVLGYIPARHRASNYQIIVWEGAPDTSDTLQVIYKRRVRELVDDDDVILDPNMEDALTEAVLARMRFYDRKYDQGAAHLSRSNTDVETFFGEKRQIGTGQAQLRPDFRGRGQRFGF